MNRQKILRRCLLLAAGAALLSSCATPKEVVYFQDLQQTDGTLAAVQAKEIRVRPDDKISIIVNSRDPQLTDLFNLPYVSRQLGQTLRSVTSTYGQSQGVSGYTVDSDGNIDFPVLGKIHVEGMTREEIGRCIKDELVGQDLVKDPIVTVEFMNLTVSVMGEVAKPGRYAIERDRITILDALSMAGDLTIYGRRDAVMGVLPPAERPRVRGAERREGARVHRERQQHPLHLVLDFARLAADLGGGAHHQHTLRPDRQSALSLNR